MLDYFIQNNWIDYQIIGKKSFDNSKFISNLYDILNKNGILIPNLEIFKEYYILNDLDYLNYKNKLIN
jgi:hypothetical protein